MGRKPCPHPRDTLWVDIDNDIVRCLRCWEVLIELPPKRADGKGSTMHRELRDRRRWHKESEGLLAYLCDISGVQCHTWYPVEPQESHPEDDRRLMVETGENGSGEFVLVRFGFDSDVARLVDWIESKRQAESVDKAEEA